MTVTVSEWSRDAYIVSNDPARLQLDVIHAFLARSYWAPKIPMETVVHSLQHSIGYGVYQDGIQAGFARVITDFTTLGYLADVFVLEEHRSRGLARWLVRCILETPELATLRRWVLITRDAHAIYHRAGFSQAAHPERYMEIVRINPYDGSSPGAA